MARIEFDNGSDGWDSPADAGIATPKANPWENTIWTDAPTVNTSNVGVTDPGARAGTPTDPNSSEAIDAENRRLAALQVAAGNANTPNTPDWQKYIDQAVASAGGSSAPSSGDLMSRIQAALAAAKSTDDPNYWYQKISADPNGAGSAWGYWVDRINRGNGAGLGLPLFQDGGGAAAPFLSSGTNPGGYTDPSSMLYLNEVLKRLQQVGQPQDNSILDLLKSLAMSTVTKLQQKPYSAADDQALITQYREPLNQARDTAKQQAALDLSRRGIGPTSGVYKDRMKQIDQAYVKGVAQGSNQMGVDAVNKSNSNALQALQILSGLQSATNTQTDRGNAMADQAVSLAKMFPDFDATRLDQLLRASGDTNSSSSALSALTGLGNLNLNAAGMNNANDAANAAAWGKLLAALFGAI